ncbi:DNA-3-methyladenine glycosylase family protein [Ketogulonicigenium vulgare]|uniref:DNA-3-methyladenine glycosylase family protein n=1 Tax=Ketogulonicigenium vulgare TaxID=92945 RepID=UPI000314D485|nr:DNA-3-methyladenine glycosylase [Ketogulonicigenium vulgare]ALJ81115.1 3-methyladenine DNA glycosylase [Ketogulonicigenium vulgare]ANW33865.1 3-methyladenine DNA glycosylase [Ketogulonicigenium vulgare]AOZ54690.1 DNA-3-methyladenine glycosylase II [Ketogulonicigenium vulgare]
MAEQVLDVDLLLEGSDWLAQREPRFAHALTIIGPLELRRDVEGFPRLLSAIVSQQVSTASARAIWARVEGAGLHLPQSILAATDDEMRAVGLSRPKVKYARALAASGIDFEALPHLTDTEVIDRLVAVSGIGRWTAEIYAMFSLGRVDVLPAADLALQEAARDLFGLESRPTEKAFRALAAPWQPWRSVASTLLWRWYREVKGRAGV